jgi:hypothetical protein
MIRRVKSQNHQNLPPINHPHGVPATGLSSQIKLTRQSPDQHPLAINRKYLHVGINTNTG